MLWIHSRGYYGPWDAPLALRSSLLDESDPWTPTFVTPPEEVVSTDHDALLGYRAAYAAQTIVLDECVGGLLAAAEQVAGPELLIVLVGSRGFALGEHGVVGRARSELYGELLHVPCVLCVAGRSPAPPRRAGLATPTDLGATLATWLGSRDSGWLVRGVDLTNDAAPRRQYVVSHSGGEHALRTPDWFLRQPAPVTDAGVAALELYVKPDDRWEANEVADRCADVSESLLATLELALDADDRAAFLTEKAAVSATEAPSAGGR
jgi:hypothetical protein